MFSPPAISFDCQKHCVSTAQTIYYKKKVTFYDINSTAEEMTVKMSSTSGKNNDLRAI